MAASRVCASAEGTAPISTAHDPTSATTPFNDAFSHSCPECIISAPLSDPDGRSAIRPFGVDGRPCLPARSFLVVNCRELYDKLATIVSITSGFGGPYRASL